MIRAGSVAQRSAPVHGQVRAQVRAQDSARAPVRVETMPRVLFVHQASDLYGSDRVLLETASALRGAGGTPIVALPGDGPLLAALRERQVEAHVLPEMHLLKLSRAVMSARGAWALWRSVDASLAALDACVAGRRVDLVHSNTLAVLGGAHWARRRGLPHLWHVHEIVEHPRWAARVFPWLVRASADRVVCNSGATQRWLTAAQPRLASRSHVVWNGVDDLAARAVPEVVAALRPWFRPGGADIAIGLVGRINRMKGHAVLLDAAQRLHARGICGFSLVFIGSAPSGQGIHLHRLREQVAASPIAGRIRIHGFTADTASAYAALDIVCVPSTEVEAFGLVAAEAMSAGKPVVASSIGGLAEVVEHGHTGLLHRAGDAQALADALAMLLTDHGLRATLGSAGRTRYERDFSLAEMNRRMLGELVAAAAQGTAR